MKHLILFAHPQKTSFSNALKERITKTIQAQGNEAILRDLYEMNFSPVRGESDIALAEKHTVAKDVAYEQEFIKAADIITVIHPVWWGGMPAILKGYIDRVFTYGFAYAVENGGIKPLLTGKKVVIISNHGTPDEYYTQMREAMNTIEDQGIFKFCGIEVLKHQYFGAVPYVDGTVKENWLKEVDTFYQSIPNSK